MAGPIGGYLDTLALRSRAATAGEGARELQGNGEEGSNRRRGRRVVLRGK